MSNENLEAAAFDSQIEERIANGYVPDLRRATRCHYFYNNTWREPEYVKLDFGEQFDIINTAIRQHSPHVPARILEVGCGPGYLSLELARAGHSVTGIDLSGKCISIAQSVADADPWKAQRGALLYKRIDFFNSDELQQGIYDVVVFLGSLHHFRDQAKVMQRVNELLNAGGIIVLHEPTRDRITKGNAAFIHLLRVVLSAARGLYKIETIPASIDEQQHRIGQLYAALRYETPEGEKLQSANDNEAGHADMSAALGAVFDQVECCDRYAFFHEIIGGLRFDDKTNIALARFLRDMDGLLCAEKVLQATEFFYVGKRRSS